MSAYSILAKYYDALMGDFDYDGYFEFIKDRLSGEGVDLACGSGEMTIRLAKDGRKMIGVDLSGEMLNVATLKAKKMALDVKWVNLDMTQIELSHPVDFITCVCDGVNYISGNDLFKFLDRVYGLLKTDGKLIFDISTPYKLEKILGDNLFCEDLDDVTYIWSNALGDGYVDMDIDFFEKIEGDTYRRIEESHRQYTHSVDFIKSCLAKWQVEIYDGETYGKPKDKSKRLIFIATKS
ncbi:MAG: class I SAM-dependent methyltransferase [Clostridia bacterium]|nr:class I SAM-dependent methyltransferase [Clostridia bacterium]